MTAISKIQRQRGLKFASVISELAAKAPDDEIKSKMYGVVDATRKKYGYTREQKKVEISRCLDLGARTRFDIVNETPFNKQDIQELLNELVTDEIVRVEYIQINHVGPKTPHYSPIES